MCFRYNAIAYVPYQLERLLCYGLLLCCNSFLVSSIKPITWVAILLHCTAVDSSSWRPYSCFCVLGANSRPTDRILLML